MTLPHPFEDIGNVTMDRVLTTAGTVATVPFAQPVPAGIARTIRLRALSAGRAGAVRLESRIVLGRRVVARSSSILPPVVLPLPVPRMLEPGQIVVLRCRLAHRQTDANGRASAGGLLGTVDVALAEPDTTA